MGKWCLHASLFLGNKDMFKNYKRFDFWHIQTADIGGTKPWKNNCSLIWKLFKFLMTLLDGLFEMRGCWHIGLRWAIVALWATCFRCFYMKEHCWLCTTEIIPPFAQNGTSYSAVILYKVKVKRRHCYCTPCSVCKREKFDQFNTILNYVYKYPGSIQHC